MRRLTLIPVLTLFFFLPAMVLVIGYTNVTVSVAKNMIDSTPSLIVLDVRTQSEYDSGHIRNAKHIPVGELEGRLDELETADEILVYCRSGGRSASASQILADNGFSHVYNMLGGITAWIDAGYPVYVKYSSIQEAINSANGGDIIYVSSGTYYENVVANESVSLIGENRNITIIDGNYTGTVIKVEAPNVTIAGFTVQKSGNNYTNCGIQLISNGNNITQNTIQNNMYGIRVSSNYNTISRNTVMRNNEKGIRLFSSIGNTISANSLKSNHEGITIFLSSNNQVSRNIMEQNIVGISHDTSSNNTIFANTVTNNEHGVNIHYSTNTVISENTVAINELNGIFFYNSTFNSIYKNSITQSNFGGIHLLFSSNNTIYENTVDECGFGIRLGNSSDNRFIHNNFINNTQQVDSYLFNFTNLWDNGYEGNYWSNYNGTDLDGDAIGDEYLPWEAVDNYPLMNLYWNPADVNHDLKVDIYDVVLACSAYTSTPLDPHWNPHCDIAEPYGVIDIYDIVMICTSYGEEYNP